MGGKQGIWAADSRPQKTGLAELLAPEMEPGRLPIATPGIRPPGPDVPMPAHRLGAPEQKSRELWTFGEV